MAVDGQGRSGKAGVKEMRKVRDNSAGAIGGLWIWKHPETGFVVRHSNYAGCRIEVKRFLRANNYPIGGNFEEEFEENLCANGAPNLCEEFIPPTLLEKMSAFAQALYRAGKQWREPMVTADVLQERRDICEACNFYGGSTSILRVACQKCGCTSLKQFLTSSRCPIGKWS